MLHRTGPMPETDGRILSTRISRASRSRGSWWKDLRLVIQSGESSF